MLQFFKEFLGENFRREIYYFWSLLWSLQKTSNFILVIKFHTRDFKIKKTILFLEFAPKIKKIFFFFFSEKLQARLKF